MTRPSGRRSATSAPTSRSRRNPRARSVPPWISSRRARRRPPASAVDSSTRASSPTRRQPSSKPSTRTPGPPCSGTTSGSCARGAARSRRRSKRFIRLSRRIRASSRPGPTWRERNSSRRSTARGADTRTRAPRLLLIGTLMVVGAGPSSPDPAAHRRDIDAWQARRIESLKREDGWLTLVGLYWLEPGGNTVGCDPKSRVILPIGKAPLHLATIVLGPEGAKLVAARGEKPEHDGRPVTELALATDNPGPPTVVKKGPLRFYLIDR